LQAIFSLIAKKNKERKKKKRGKTDSHYLLLVVTEVGTTDDAVPLLPFRGYLASFLHHVTLFAFHDGQGDSKEQRLR